MWCKRVTYLETEPRSTHDPGDYAATSLALAFAVPSLHLNLNLELGARKAPKGGILSGHIGHHIHVKIRVAVAPLTRAARDVKRLAGEMGGSLVSCGATQPDAARVELPIAHVAGHPNERLCAGWSIWWREGDR